MKFNKKKRKRDIRRENQNERYKMRKIRRRDIIPID